MGDAFQGTREGIAKVVKTAQNSWRGVEKRGRGEHREGEGGDGAETPGGRPKGDFAGQ